ncbi:CapA family protein [Patescibacteria group bacterium]|nr:CapA family protein [Patescibacteria group bacterium]
MNFLGTRLHRNLLVALLLIILELTIIARIPQGPPQPSQTTSPPPTSNTSPTIMSAQIPTPNAQQTDRLTDPRLKNWLAKIPSTVDLTNYLSVVVIPEQKNYIFYGKELLKIYTISTGSGENNMLESVWRIGEKKQDLGGIYGPRLMFLEVWDSTSFKKTTRAFHGTNEPEKIGTNFGLGCVYHNNNDILELYDLLPRDSLVITTNNHQAADWEILIGGTVVLSRGVDERIRKYNNVNYPWEKIAPLTQAADLTIINLKSPFVEDCPYVADKPVFCAQTNYIKGLPFAGVDVVGIAGNHLGDYGVSGIEYTTQVLADNNILFTGAGENIEQALKSQIITLQDSSSNQLKVGFLAFNTVAGTSPAASAELSSAVENSTGVAWWDETVIKTVVEQIDPLVDVLITMPNWGPEYTHQPTQGQIDIGRKLVDWGANVVTGDQAHWVQKYEEYNSGLIFYGLGNLIFDQMWSEKTRQGLLVKLIIGKDKKVAYELIPIIIEDYAQPRLATAREAEQILHSIK